MQENKTLYIALYDQPSVQVALQYVPKVTTNRSANLSTVEIPGRSNPILHYTTGSDSLELKLAFHNSNDPTYVSSISDQLKSCCYGQDLIVVLGNFMVNQVYVLEKVESNFDHLQALQYFFPKTAEISLSFKLNPNRSILPEDLRRGQNSIAQNEKMNFETRELA